VDKPNTSARAVTCETRGEMRLHNCVQTGLLLLMARWFYVPWDHYYSRIATGNANTLCCFVCFEPVQFMAGQHRHRKVSMLVDAASVSILFSTSKLVSRASRPSSTVGIVQL